MQRRRVEISEGWLKSIDKQVKLTNGTVRQNEKDIIILQQWKKIKEKTEDYLKEQQEKLELEFWRVHSMDDATKYEQAINCLKTI